MGTRIFVPGPSPFEESRQLAEAVSDIHYVVNTIVGGSGELVPGEAVDELNAAWAESQDSFSQLVNVLSSNSGNPTIPYQTLLAAQLTGDVGRIKRSTSARLRDRFFMFWNSEPRTDEKRVSASDAADQFLDWSATLVSSIPGYENVVELLSLVKQLVQIRAKRGT